VVAQEGGEFAEQAATLLQAARVSQCGDQSVDLEMVGLGARDQAVGDAGVADKAGEQALALGAEVRQEAGAPEVDDDALHLLDLVVAGLGQRALDVDRDDEAAVMVAGEADEGGVALHLAGVVFVASTSRRKSRTTRLNSSGFSQ
jgi:hypothetical protein